jgi:Holliday junction resolvase
MKPGKKANYVLGRAREHSFRYKLIKEGWFCIRCQGSAGGSPNSKVRPIDLIAIRSGVVWFIQVSKRLRDISHREIDELTTLARRYGATPVIAYKDGREWTVKKLA